MSGSSCATRSSARASRSRSPTGDRHLSAAPVTILVVGDLVTDVLTRYRPPLAVGSDTAATVSFGCGGSAANTAAWLGYAGAPVTLVAVVGDDPSGAERVAELTTAGVDCAV